MFKKSAFRKRKASSGFSPGAKRGKRTTERGMCERVVCEHGACERGVYERGMYERDVCEHGACITNSTWTFPEHLQRSIAQLYAIGDPPVPASRNAVIRRFLGNGHVVYMTFRHPRTGNLHKPRPGAHLFNIGAAGVAHG